MENIGMGAGLVALSFWLFVAAVSVAGIWDGAKKREQKHETFRRIIESNKELDEKTLSNLMALVGGSSRPDRDFKVASMWILPIAPGFALFAYFIGRISQEAFYPLIGVSCVLLFMGIGFWIAGMITERWYLQDAPKR